MKRRGKRDLLTEEDLKPENVRMRISMMLPLDLMDAYKAEAEKLGIGYQTLMQMRLREALSKPAVEIRLERIERELFKKRA